MAQMEYLCVLDMREAFHFIVMDPLPDCWLTVYSRGSFLQSLGEHTQAVLVKSNIGDNIFEHNDVILEVHYDVASCSVWRIFYSFIF